MSAASFRQKTLYVWNTKATLARNPKAFEHLGAVLQRAFAPDIEVSMMPPYESLQVFVSKNACRMYSLGCWQIVQLVLWENGIFASEQPRPTLSELCPDVRSKANSEKSLTR